ncbi:hypothetical protein FOCC_FOCC005911 [Frankliniella occidentalis]|nr:hypothetical protein FOCC_FOCC005911 [Frankliniella occidentalis]
MTHVSPCVLQFAGKMVGTENMDVQLSAEDHRAYGAASSQVIAGASQVLTAPSPGLQTSQQTIQTLHAETPVITQAIQVSESLANAIQTSISTTRKINLKHEAGIAWLEQEIGKDFEVPKVKADGATLLLCPWCSVPYAAPMYLERHKKQCRKRLETVTLEEAQSQVDALAQAEAQVQVQVQAQAATHIQPQVQTPVAVHAQDISQVHSPQIVQLQAAQVPPNPIHAAQVQSAHLQAVQVQLQGGQVQVAQLNGQSVMLSMDRVAHVCGVTRGTCNRCSPSKVLRNSITPSITVEEVPIDIACSQLFTQERDITDSVVYLDRPFCFTVNNKGFLTADPKPNSNLTGKQFICPECGERFSKNSLLKEHSKTHAGEKPFGCIECGMRFSCSTLLKDHCRFHAGEKEFGCTDCGLWFSTSEQLTEHFRAHQHEKEFDEYSERRDLYALFLVSCIVRC